jgi:hypothetical protein
MPYCRIEHGIEEAAVMIHKCGLLPLADILNVLVISRHTFYCIWWLYRKTGSVVMTANPAQWHSCILLYDDLNYLLRLVNIAQTGF